MRLYEEKVVYLKRSIKMILSGSEVYLFGSRTDDKKNGGDIDIMVLSQEYLEKKALRQIKIGFYKKFGWQKVDIVNFLYSENNSFKYLVLQDAIKL